MVPTQDPEEIKRKVQKFREWINSQPHLPKDLSDHLAHRFLHSCYYDMEKSKKSVEWFCSLRTNSPELFHNRDPLSDSVQKTLEIVNLGRLQISKNRNLWIWQLNDPGLEKFDYMQDVRLFFLTTDSWLLDETGGFEEEDIALLDVKDVSLKMITKFNISVARKLSKYQEDAMPIRLKQVHLVNAPSHIDKIFGLMRPFMKQEQCDKIKFHAPKSDTLFKYLDKEDVPEDFGGTMGKMEDHMRTVVENMVSKREYLLNDNLWKAIIIKKSKNSKEIKESPKADGGTSFRSLAID